MQPPAVEIDGLVVRYGERVAVNDLSLRVPAGSVTAVLGPNGAGKTTTLETCEGYRVPAAGKVQVLGLDPRRDGRALHARVGVMLQNGGIPSGARAGEVIGFAARLYAQPLDPVRLATELGLTGLRTTFRRMSGGEQQRVKLALAIVGRPELVFLDEPTAGLDPQARHLVWDLITRLRADGVTVVLSTHLLDEAERLADEVIVIDQGRVVGHGSPAELTNAARCADLTFRTAARLDVADLARALPPANPVSESPPGTYRVGGPIDPHVLAAVTAWCARNQVMPLDLNTGKRTLEDVFLALTGPRSPRPQERR